MKDAFKAIAAVVITMVVLVIFGWVLVHAGQFAVNAWNDAWRYNYEHYSQMANR